VEQIAPAIEVIKERDGGLLVQVQFLLIIPSPDHARRDTYYEALRIAFAVG
jgi:hypothetical protein